MTSVNSNVSRIMIDTDTKNQDNKDFEYININTAGNLLNNWSFETGTIGWYPLNCNVKTSNWPGTNLYRCDMYLPMSYNYSLYQDVQLKVKAGSTYDISAFFKTDGSPLEVRFRIITIINRRVYHYFTPYQLISEGTERVKAVCYLPKKGTNTKFYIDIENRSRTPVVIDSVILEEKKDIV